MWNSTARNVLTKLFFPSLQNLRQKNASYMMSHWYSIKLLLPLQQTIYTVSTICGKKISTFRRLYWIDFLLKTFIIIYHTRAILLQYFLISLWARKKKRPKSYFDSNKSEPHVKQRKTGEKSYTYVLEYVWLKISINVTGERVFFLPNISSALIIFSWFVSTQW